MDSATTSGIIRAILAALGGILVTKGYVDDATLQQVIGALVTIITVIWSVLSNRSQAKTTATAALTGVNPNTVSPTATGSAQPTIIKDQSGVVGVVAALLIAMFAGAVITADNPKVVKVINEDLLHKNDPNYTVPENPSPTKH